MRGAIKQLVLQLNWFPLNKSQFEQILLQFFLPKPSFALNFALNIVQNVNILYFVQSSPDTTLFFNDRIRLFPRLDSDVRVLL